jgi:probable DNA repair protein
MLINASLKKVTNKTIIVVANERQVIAFKNTYIKEQNSQVVPLPKIFSWQKFLVFIFNQIEHTSNLISPLTQKIIWQDIIKNNALFPKVFNEYQLIHSYKIPVIEESFKSIFYHWLKTYQDKLQQNNWIDQQQLCALIEQHLDKIPEDLCFYGFNHYTPEMLDFLEKVPHIISETEHINQSYNSVIYKNLEDELLYTALWVKQKRENQEKSVAIVVDNIQEIKTPLSLIFDDVLHQDKQPLETHQKQYNISSGNTLIEYPFIMDCVNFIKFAYQYASDELEPKLVEKVFLSPFLKGFDTEKNLRAESINHKTFRQLSLNRVNVFEVSPKVLAKLLNHLPTDKDWFQNQKINFWAEFFYNILEALCFSAQIPSSSTNFQLLQKLRETIFEFNQLVIIDLKFDQKQALNLFEQTLKQTIFQPKSARTNIHILGLLEVQGLFFDEVRFLDFNQKVLPQSVKKLDFITDTTAKNYHLPNMTHQSCFEHATNLLTHLQNSGSQVQFSYAQQKEDLTFQENTLIDWENSEFGVKKIKPSLKLQFEETIDNQAPKVIDKKVRSGVKILSNQAICSFKGFATRLNINDYEDDIFGFSHLEKGSILHKALELLTLDHRNKQSLAKLSDKDIQGFIKQAIKKYPKNKEIIKLEEQRLLKLIKSFLAKEQERDDFEITAIEKKQAVNINGLEFEVRLDRMDEVSGQSIVFDYKSSLKKKADLTRNPLQESQLPIYAINNKPDAISFIGLTLAEIKYVGLGEIVPFKKEKNISEYLDNWQQQLEQTSLNFQEGIADVLPEKGACEYCDLNTLCRI